MGKTALCIGINDYPGTDSDLAGCVNDAHDWTALLQGRGFAVRQLIDAQATKAAMVAQIGGLIDAAGSGDTVVITYSGHGTWLPDTSGDEADGRDEALCPHDIAEGNALVDDELATLFGARAAGVRIVLISDSCHSGSVIRSAADQARPGEPRRRFLPPAVWLGDAVSRLQAPPRWVAGGLSRVGGDLLLAGCLDTEFSYDTQFGGRPSGAFTHYALKALGRLPADATYQQWFRAIRNDLPSTALPQTPQILGSRSARDFIIFD